MVTATLLTDISSFEGEPEGGLGHSPTREKTRRTCKILRVVFHWQVSTMQILNENCIYVTVQIACRTTVRFREIGTAGATSDGP